MTTKIMTAALNEYLARKDFNSLKVALEKEHAADLANFVGGLEPKEAWSVLDLMSLDRQAEVFGYLPHAMQGDLAETASRARLAQLVTQMDADERADMFNSLSEEQQNSLLPALAQAEREDIRKLASYEEGTAGSVMTSDYAALTSELTVREAIEKLRKGAPDKETIYDAYVINDKRQLLGVVSLRDLLLAKDSARIADIMRTEVIFARAHDSREEAARLIARYDLLALPIINGGEMLVGIITADDAMDVQSEAATREFRKIGGMQEGLGHKGAALAPVTDLKSASVFLLYRMRVFWLVLLVFGNIFSGAGIAYFEETIAAYVALVFFLPLLIDSGGNAGSQAATLMVRGLATGDVRIRDWSRMVGKEVLVAGLLGLTMAIAVSAIGVFRAGPEIAVVVSFSMIIIVLVGSVIGMSLPFILSRFKMDPAAASAPLITSIADAAGVLIYFYIATSFLLLP